MSKPIKFRAWDGKKMWRPEMLGMNAYLLEPSGKGIFHLTRHECRDRGALLEDWQKSESDLVPMQFTGLLDKNGIEIYEGDKVKHPRTTWIIKTVRYVQHKGAWYAGSHRLTSQYAEDCIVVGNIYELSEATPQPIKRDTKDHE